MGEGESLNEMVRSAGGYLDPAAATTVANAMMMAGERDGACSIARNWQLHRALRTARQRRLRLPRPAKRPARRCVVLPRRPDRRTVR